MAATPRIYLIRHGETEWNAEHRIQGHLDSDLTPLGRTQALENGARLRATLAGQPFPLVFSSPLGRCRETAALVLSAMGRDDVEIRFDDRLKEHGYGDWEGLTKDEVARSDAERHSRREENKWDVTAPNGESYALVAERLLSWLADMEGKTLIAVSHGCAGRILRGVYANMPKAQIYDLKEAHDEIYVLAEGRVETL